MIVLSSANVVVHTLSCEEDCAWGQFVTNYDVISIPHNRELYSTD